VKEPVQIHHNAQESVWQYPRPPLVERSNRLAEVIYQGIPIAVTRRAFRVLETGHPPVYYFPPEDVQMEYLEPTDRITWCEWKGRAGYFSIRVGERRVEAAAWSYPQPTAEFQMLRDYLAFYAHLADLCRLDGEVVRAQGGGYYGGWITNEIVGPFRGEWG